MIKFSLLAPTRKRPDKLKRLYDSALATASTPKNVELIIYIDDNDPSYDELNLPQLVKFHGPQISISHAWNQCWLHSKGEYLGLVADDIIFKTNNWDQIIENKFSRYKDRITYVFGDDGTAFGRQFGTHGFIHATWAAAIGYFVPPYFEANQVDRWLNEVARRLQRLQFGDIELEHLHYAFGKSDKDDTYQDGQDRAAGAEIQWNVRQLELENDVKKLQRLIDDFPKN